MHIIPTTFLCIISIALGGCNEIPEKAKVPKATYMVCNGNVVVNIFDGNRTQKQELSVRIEGDKVIPDVMGVSAFSLSYKLDICHQDNEKLIFRESCDNDKQKFVFVRGTYDKIAKQLVLTNKFNGYTVGAFKCSNVELE